MQKTITRRSDAGEISLRGNGEFIDNVQTSYHLLSKREKVAVQQYLPRIYQSDYHTRIETKDVPTMYHKHKSWYETEEGLKYIASTIIHETKHSIDFATIEKMFDSKKVHELYGVVPYNPRIYSLEIRAIRSQIKTLESLGADQRIIAWLRTLKGDHNNIPIDQQ